MFSKWKIKGIESHRFGEDKKLYKLGYESNGRFYATREVKKQHPNRYWVNGEWLSEIQIRNRLVLDQNPIKLFECVDNIF